MTKVLMLARTFPAYHPKKGQPTLFIEKFWKSIGLENWQNEIMDLNPKFGPFNIDDSGEVLNAFSNQIIHYQGDPKYTTIRAGNTWKVGDKFSPRVWSGKPYNSPQITIAPDIEIVKVWKFEIRVMQSPHVIGGIYAAALIDEKPVFGNKYFELAKNDGLDHVDMVDWLQPKRKPTAFLGHIICWNKAIEY